MTHDIGVGRRADRIIRMLDGRVMDDGAGLWAAAPLAPAGAAAPSAADPRR
ncbi:MAG: hypothetical protein ACKVWR_15855 [Acidimicrobiales bacterium]